MSTEFKNFEDYLGQKECECEVDFGLDEDGFCEECGFEGKIDMDTILDLCSCNPAHGPLNTKGGCDTCFEDYCELCCPEDEDY